MHIVSTFHQPSSVLCSLKSLVVAKLNGLDVYSVLPEGLKHECRWEVWGNILSVKSVPIPDSSRSNVVVMTDHPNPELIFLTYTQSAGIGGELTTLKRLGLFERNQRPAEFFNDIVIHPAGELAVVNCYTGKLKGILLKEGNFQREFDISLMELVILSLAFIPSTDEYTLAILHQDHTRRVQLLARTIENEDISRDLSTVLHPTPISSKILPYPEDNVPMLIPVPCPEESLGTDRRDDDDSFIGGILVVGGTRILLYELASPQGQEKQKNKRRRLEKGKESQKQAEVDEANKKQKEREAKKRKPKAGVDWPWSQVTSWCALDDRRYLIGDCFGRLSMLSLHDVPRNGLILMPLGETSPPTTLTYIANQVLYVGSHAGDPQLVQISTTPLSSSDESPTLPIPLDIKAVPPSRLAPSPKGKGKEVESDPLRDCVLDTKGSYVRVIETFKNIAPILDAALVDTDNSGHQQIVTCSGGQNTGSINVVRNGADFQQLATIAGMPHTMGIFPLRRMFDDMLDSHILLSTLHETHVFELDQSGSTMNLLDPADEEFAPGRTLAALNIQRMDVVAQIKRGNTIITPATIRYADAPLVVQVTSKGAFLLEYDMGLQKFSRIAEYDVMSRESENGEKVEVVAASINPGQILLALSGGSLICLEAPGTSQLKRKSRGWKFRPEISAVSCTLVDPSHSTTEFVVASYWKHNHVEIFRQDDGKFVSVYKTDPLPALVRNLLWYNLGSDQTPQGDYHPYLFAGMADGSFSYFTWNEEQTLGEPKTTSLGHAPVHFTPCQVDGKLALFAAGSRATVLTWERERVHNSPVMLKEVMAVAQINNDQYTSSLIMANESALFVGRVRDVSKMHIRSIPLGFDAPQRIVYEPTLKVFGVACTRREPTRVGTSEPSPRSSFRLVDDTSFNHLSQYNCQAEEEIMCVTTLTLDHDDQTTSFFCLGTCMVHPDERVAAEGRVLVFTANSGAQSRSSGPQLSLAASANVQGCVYAVTAVNGLLAAGVNSAVVLFRLEIDSLTRGTTLHKVSILNLNYFVTSLVGHQNRLVVGDQISSVSLLEVTEESKLRTLGRDLTPLSPICVQALDEKHFLAANDTLNLISFTLDAENKKLERDGFYQQSDLLTKFVRGSITAADAGSKLQPIQMFFASSGRIGVVVDIADKQLALDLTALQRNMAGVIGNDPTKGEHTKFRTPQSTARSRVTESAYGFLDGDFMEQLLSCSTTQLAKITVGSSEPERLTNLQELHKELKNLQALH
ncbi:CPSF A subunit region-domain-containing protein [Mycena sp. CBHHK59/15]|nr:CPSF A subunit region-domain-containing protein [Mycena sp. CBHHK59/15]